MIKKYVMIVAVLLVIFMFTSTSTASVVSGRGKIYEMLQENFHKYPVIKNIIEKFSQVVSDNDDSVPIYTDDDNDGDDEDYDDGEHDDEIDPDGPKEDVLLPKVWNIVGEITPDGGNEPVEDLEETSNTIDLPDGDEDGALSSDGTIDLNGKEGAVVANEKIIDKNGGEGVITEKWTVDEGEWTVKLDRIVEIVTKLNGKLGVFLERVIEHTVDTDENGISSSGSGGSAENNIVDDIILTDSNQ